MSRRELEVEQKVEQNSLEKILITFSEQRHHWGVSPKDAQSVRD
jgi:hypothetical protein